MANLSGILMQLKDERDRVEKQLSALNAAFTAFVNVYSGSAKRKMSAAARKKISLAQKARWAKQAASNKTSSVKPKRTMSAAARKRIAAAQRARWAKVRAGKKAA